MLIFAYDDYSYDGFTYRTIYYLRYGDASIIATVNSSVNVIVNEVVTCSVAGNASLTVSARLKQWATANILGHADVTSNGVNKAFEEASIRGAGTVLVANSIIRTFGALDILVTGAAKTDTIVKVYTSLDMPTISQVVSECFVKALAYGSISGHAVVNTNSIRRMFEEVIISSASATVADTVIGVISKSNLISSAGLGVDTIEIIYDNASIACLNNVVCGAYRAYQLTDSPCVFFQMNDRTYIANGTDYIYYDGNFHDVIGYVPTITLGRAPSGGGTKFEDLNYLSNSWKDSFSGTTSDTVYRLSFSNITSVDEVVANGLVVDPANYTVDTVAGTVTFSSAPGEGIDNIVIKATKEGLMDATHITKCTRFQVYGGKTDTRIFAGRHPTLANYRFYSGLNDPTYWPESAYDLVGSDEEAIEGFGRLIDYQIIGKSRSYYYSYAGDVDTEGIVSFPILPFNDEFGCLSGLTMQPAQGGLLALSSDHEGNPAGVAWITPTMVRGQLNVRIISENINKSRGMITGLCDYALADLKAAHAIIHDNKYYLFIKDKTWVLDLNYSDLSSGVACWYPYDTGFGRVACFLSRYDGDLYIGDNTAGLIYKPRKENTAYPYQDDTTAFNSYWTTPLIFCGSRNWEKKFTWLRLTFKGQPEATHTLTFITDQGEVIPLVHQESVTFDYSKLDYGNWSYGVNTYPYPQSEKVGYNSVYLQWKLSNNNPAQSMTILNQLLEYKLAKVVK